MRLSQFNFADFYSPDVFTDYTPGYLYILSFLGFLKNSLAIGDNYYFLVLKIPALISDILIGLIIYKEIAKSFSRKTALLAAGIMLFNPVTLFNSAVWGQIDSVLTLFMLLAVIKIQDHKLSSSLIFFSLAVLIKPQAAAIAPLYFLSLLTKFKLVNLIKILFIPIAVAFILSVPFFPEQTLINLGKHILNTAAQYPYTSLNAYNFWGAVGFWIKDYTIWTGLAYRYWGYIFLFAYWTITFFFYFRKKLSFFALAALGTLAFFFLPTKVHERYLYPAIIFLILLLPFYKTRLLLFLIGVLSLLHFLNLYYVYVYYNEIYFKMPKMLFNFPVFNFLTLNAKNLSILSTIIFILISIVIIKFHVNLKKN